MDAPCQVAVTLSPLGWLPPGRGRGAASPTLCPCPAGTVPSCVVTTGTTVVLCEVLHFHHLHPYLHADPTPQLLGDKAEGGKGCEAENSLENSLEELASSWEKQSWVGVGRVSTEWGGRVELLSSHWAACKKGWLLPSSTFFIFQMQKKEIKSGFFCSNVLLPHQ